MHGVNILQKLEKYFEVLTTISKDIRVKVGEIQFQQVNLKNSPFPINLRKFAILKLLSKSTKIFWFSGQLFEN